MPIQRHFTNTPWELKVGYCRALRAGQTIYLSGTAPTDSAGNTFAPDDPYVQACRCFEIIKTTLEAMDAGIHQVVRTNGLDRSSLEIALANPCVGQRALFGVYINIITGR